MEVGSGESCVSCSFPPLAQTAKTKALTSILLEVLLCPRLLRLVDPVLPLLQLGVRRARIKLGLQCLAVEDPVGDSGDEGRVTNDL